MLRMDTWRLNVCAVPASQGGFSLDGAIVAYFSREICRNSEGGRDFFLFFVDFGFYVFTDFSSFLTPSGGCFLGFTFLPA